MNKMLQLMHLEAYVNIIPFLGFIPNYSPVRFSPNLKDPTSHLTVKKKNSDFGHYLGRAAG
jgi:hypothetical protein